MIIDDLITDRTQEDVDEVYSLKSKFKTVDDSTGYILIKHLQEKDLVFDGTQSELNKYMAGLKGALNYTDLNRIGNAIRYIRMIFDSLRISHQIVGKNDWQAGDYVSQTDVSTIISDLNQIKSATNSQIVFPQSFNKLNFEGLNSIEALLKDAYEIMSMRMNEYQVGGSVVSGVNDWLTENGGEE